MFPVVPGMIGDMNPSRDQHRAARYVVARRGELNLTQQELADRAEVDGKTIYNLESGERWPRANTRAKIERELGWTNGSLEVIATGGQPGRIVQVGQATETTIAQPVRPVRWQDGDDMPEGLDDAEKDLWETADDRMEFELLRRAHRRAVEIRAEMAAEDRQDRRERHEGHHEREDRDDRARRHG